MAISANSIGLMFRLTADSSQATAETRKAATGITQSVAAIKVSFGSLNQQTNLLGKAFAGMLTPLGLTTLAIGAITTAATAAAIGLFKLSTEAVDVDVKLDKLRQRTGVSVDFLRLLDNAARETGVGFDVVDRSLDQFFSRLDKARSTQGRTRDIFAGFGFKTKEDFDEAFKNPQQAIIQTITALQALKSETEFGVKAQEAFGLRNQDIAAIIRALGGDLEAYRKKVEFLYGTTTKEAIAQSRVFKSTLADTSLAADGLGNMIGRALMPATQGLTGAFKEGLVAARLFIQDGLKVMGVDAEAVTMSFFLLQAAIRTVGQQSENFWKGVTAGRQGFGGLAGGLGAGVGAVIEGFDTSKMMVNFVKIRQEYEAAMKRARQGGGTALGGEEDAAGKGGESRARIRILEEQLKQAKIMFQAETEALKDALERQAISREEFTQQMISKARALHKVEMELLAAETAEAEQGDLKDKEKIVRLEQIKTKTIQINREFEKTMQDISMASAEAIAKGFEEFSDMLDKMSAGLTGLRRELLAFQRETEGVDIERDQAHLEKIQGIPGQRRAAIELGAEIAAKREGLRHNTFQDSINAQREDIETEIALRKRKRELFEDLLAKEEALNRLQESEAARHMEVMEGINSRQQMSLMPDIGAAGREALLNGASMFQAFSASAKAAFTEVGASAANFQQMMTGAFSAVAQGAEQMLAGFFATGKLGGAAFRQMTASILASIAIQSIVKAIFEQAEGMAALASFNIPAAVAHFAASKFYIKAAAVAGIAGVALAATAGGGDTGGAGGGAGATGQQGRGNLTIDQGGDRRPVLNIILRGDGAALIGAVEADYTSNGRTRQMVRKDVLGEG